MKKTLKTKAMTGALILVVIGILVLVNILSAGLFGRLDLTKDSLYSLSKGSKDLMHGLDDQVTAKAYFTAELPAPYNLHAQFVKDLFEEYAAYSKGKFSYEIVDPGDKDETRNDMMLLGIPPVQIQEVKNDKFEVKQAYLGIVLTYADKKEVLPVIKSIDNLEYEITAAVRKLTSAKLRKVGVLAGHGEPSLTEEMRQTMQGVQKNYQVVPVDMTQNKNIPDDIDTLMVVNPTKKLEDADLFAIDQFLMKGKNIAFFTSAVSVDLQSFQATNIDNGLAQLLKAYGINVNQNLVADLQNKRINVASQQGMYRVSNIVNYPLIPVVTDFDKSNSLTGRLDALALPFPSSLDVAASTSDVTYTILGRSSPRSWTQTGAYDVNPLKEMMPAADAKTGPFPLLAMAQGKFTSAFTNNKDGKPFIADPSKVVTKSPNARILVVGNGLFAQDKFGDPSGAIFLANAIDWLGQDEALIAIRAREGGVKPLKEMEPWEKGVIKYGNMIGVPVLFILFGGLLWSLRRARRRGFMSGMNSK